MISHIQEQLEDDNINIITFDDKESDGITKLSIDIAENVIEYMNVFRDCVSYMI